MFRVKKYRIRHAILKTLEHHRTNAKRNDLTDWMEEALDFSELVAKSHLTEQDVSEQLYYLINEKEIFDEELRPLDIIYRISSTGIAAFYDKKYLNIGMREFLNNSYDILKNISTAVLLIFAIVTFVSNYLETKKNKNEIELLKNEIKDLKRSDKINKHSK